MCSLGVTRRHRRRRFGFPSAPAVAERIRAYVPRLRCRVSVPGGGARGEQGCHQVPAGAASEGLAHNAPGVVSPHGSMPWAVPQSPCMWPADECPLMRCLQRGLCAGPTGSFEAARSGERTSPQGRNRVPGRQARRSADQPIPAIALSPPDPAKATSALRRPGAIPLCPWRIPHAG